jgi:hypothetical protein
MNKYLTTKRILGISMNKIVYIVFLLLSLLISLALPNAHESSNNHPPAPIPRPLLLVRNQDTFSHPNLV